MCLVKNSAECQKPRLDAQLNTLSRHGNSAQCHALGSMPSACCTSSHHSAKKTQHVRYFTLLSLCLWPPRFGARWWGWWAEQKTLAARRPEQQAHMMRWVRWCVYFPFDVHFPLQGAFCFFTSACRIITNSQDMLPNWGSGHKWICPLLSRPQRALCAPFTALLVWGCLLCLPRCSFLNVRNTAV